MVRSFEVFCLEGNFSSCSWEFLLSECERKYALSVEMRVSERLA